MSKDVRSFTSKGRSNVTCLPLLYCWALFVLQFRAYSYALSLLVTCSPTPPSCRSRRAAATAAVLPAATALLPRCRNHAAAAQPPVPPPTPPTLPQPLPSCCQAATATLLPPPLPCCCRVSCGIAATATANAMLPQSCCFCRRAGRHASPTPPCRRPPNNAA
jgi:hypothetical protein